MYKNSGEKIKGVAIFMAIMGYTAAFIIFVLMCQEKLPPDAIVIVIAVVVLSWLSNLALAGFGQLIENSDKICTLLQKHTGVNLDEENNKEWIDRNPEWNTVKDMANKEIGEIQSNTVAAVRSNTNVSASEYHFCMRCGNKYAGKPMFCSQCGMKLNG